MTAEDEDLAICGQVVIRSELRLAQRRRRLRRRLERLLLSLLILFFGPSGLGPGGSMATGKILAADM
ncbi:hypothetical protein ACWEPL_28000 [Nonomuraea sp. NPDC004186]